MTSSDTAKVTLPTDDQILITREFDAPKQVVYRAWTTPERVRRWWSGQRGEVTIAEIDLRVGGMWRYLIGANGGFEVAFHGEYREIVPNERIVSTEVCEARPEGEALNTITFTEVDEHHAQDPHAADEHGGPRYDHQLGDGGRHAGVDGLPGAGRDLAAVSARGVPLRDIPSRASISVRSPNTRTKT